MITTVAGLLSQIRSFVNDPQGDMTSLEFVLPLIQAAQDQLVAEVMKNPNLGQISAKVVLSNVAAGTESLSAYFQTDGDLSLLSDVITMKERAVTGSRSEQDWLEMGRKMDLPTLNSSSFSGYFSFRGNDIAILPSDQIMDYRIFGKFEPANLDNESSPIIPGTSTILARRAAADISAIRGNQSLANWHGAFSDRAQTSFICDAIMELQGVRTRMRSYSGRGRSSVP